MSSLPQPVDHTADNQSLYGDWQYEGVIDVPTEDFWVFGYGSLIWNPGFPHVDEQVAVLHGYNRQFCVKSVVYRGTPDSPGLVLGLVPGGRVSGKVFKVPAQHAAKTVEYLEYRELRFESYDVKWANCKLRDGRTVKALTFVMPKKAPSLVNLCEDEVVEVLATRSGQAGTNRAYLDNLCEGLRAEGVGVGNLARLQKLVENYAACDHLA